MAAKIPFPRLYAEFLKSELLNWFVLLAGRVRQMRSALYNAGESVLDLFSRTDTAMYLAKRGGRIQVVAEGPHVEPWQNATP